MRLRSARVRVLATLLIVGISLSLPLRADDSSITGDTGQRIINAASLHGSARRVKAGRSIAIARNKSAQMAPALFDEIEPSLKQRLREKGYDLTTMDEAELYLVFDVATDELKGCVSPGVGGAGTMEFSFQNRFSNDSNEGAVSRITIPVALDNPTANCPRPFDRIRWDGHCPTDCQFNGWVHHATVSVFAAEPFRKKERVRLLWDGVALLADVENRDPAEDEAIAEFPLRLVESAFEPFPRSGNQR